MNVTKKLRDHFLQLDLKQAVPKTETDNQAIEQGACGIVKRALDRIVKEDPRFHYVLHGTGSFFDGVKVGVPDEFDYIVEITSLSSSDCIKLVTTDDPGFIQIKPLSKAVELWKDCLINPRDLKTMKSGNALLHDFKENTMKSPAQIPLDVENCILDPTKLQTTFKEKLDKAMFDIDLPTDWEHGGHDKPNYSGCRRHGPAALIQLINSNKGREIKVTVDITLGIAVPLPVNFKQELNMNVFDKIDAKSPLNKILLDARTAGPKVHLIPLYSKMLVRTGRYDNKFSFRISCSCIEKSILNVWPDNSGPKKCIRILKAIRDEYFSEEKRKTCRHKKRHKKHEKRTITKGEEERKQCEIDKKPRHKKPSKKIPVHEFVNRMNDAEKDWTKEMKRFDALKKGLENDECSADDESGDIIDIEQIDELQQQINNLCKTFSETEILVKSLPTAEKQPRNQYHSLSEEASDSESTITDIEVSSCELPTDAILIHDQPRQPSATMATQQNGHSSDDVTSKVNSPIADAAHWNSEVAPGHCELEKTQTHQFSDSLPETTDITEWAEEKTKEEALRKFQSTRMMYQAKDIADMVSKPGTGEYYGPKTYMASIEIKTYVLRLLGYHWDLQDWNDYKVTEYILDFLQSYHTCLLKKQMFINLFFDTFVCSPISDEQRIKAIEAYNKLQTKLNDIMAEENKRMEKKPNRKIENWTLPYPEVSKPSRSSYLLYGGYDTDDYF